MLNYDNVEGGDGDDGDDGDVGDVVDDDDDEEKVEVEQSIIECGDEDYGRGRGLMGLQSFSTLSL